MTSETWQELHKSANWGRWPAESVVAYFCGRWAPTERRAVHVLDVGCGAGANTRMLVDEGFTTVALDCSQDALTRTKYNLRRWDLPKVELVCHDLSNPLPFSDGQFSAILDSLTLTHLSDDQHRAALAEIARVLKPGGRFVQRVFIKGCRPIEGRGFVRYWSPLTLAGIAPKGLWMMDGFEESCNRVKIGFVEWGKA